ncbi:hypothetical protein JOD97_000872 [Duganella sp. 1411]|uniref:GAD-like domain-containing protein n=1 Tax=Duganella sp. 1411 TaxID=2806572 RepID=UPI001AE24ECC|nr:GAD-like domain-containing protein [Duganella sp. 1411]MBP1202858.1 hypothetical protein [Duganella sp. 1411]
MDEYFEIFLSDWGPQISKTQPNKAEIEEFRGKLPDKLIEYWQANGWGGYYNGLFWFTNPNEYIPVVDAWLDGTDISDKSAYFAIARTAFGRVFLWNKKTGQNATIDALSSRLIITPPDKKVIDGDDTKAFQYFISGEEPDDLDFKDVKEKPLFKKALKKLGPVAFDEMYGFEPPLCIGGMPHLENLNKVKAVEHLVLLEQLGDVEVMRIDVSSHL